MIERWIDALARVWEFDTGRNSRVKSLRVFERADIPEQIHPADFPIAISIPQEVDAEYSQGGPQFGVWKGVTEFHISQNTAKADIPYVLTYYGKIWKAAAANFRLGNRVAYFVLPSGGQSIQGPLALKYGDEAEHWGLIVNWVVKEHVEGQLTFGVGS